MWAWSEDLALCAALQQMQQMITFVMWSRTVVRPPYCSKGEFKDSVWDAVQTCKASWELTFLLLCTR